MLQRLLICWDNESDLYHYNVALKLFTKHEEILKFSRWKENLSILMILCWVPQYMPRLSVKHLRKITAEFIFNLLSHKDNESHRICAWEICQLKKKGIDSLGYSHISDAKTDVLSSAIVCIDKEMTKRIQDITGIIESDEKKNNESEYDPDAPPLARNPTYSMDALETLITNFSPELTARDISGSSGTSISVSVSGSDVEIKTELTRDSTARLLGMTSAATLPMPENEKEKDPLEDTPYTDKFELGELHKSCLHGMSMFINEYGEDVINCIEQITSLLIFYSLDNSYHELLLNKLNVICNKIKRQEYKASQCKKLVPIVMDYCIDDNFNYIKAARNIWNGILEILFNESNIFNDSQRMIEEKEDPALNDPILEIIRDLKLCTCPIYLAWMEVVQNEDLQDNIPVFENISIHSNRVLSNLLNLCAEDNETLPMLIFEKYIYPKHSGFEKLLFFGRQYGWWNDILSQKALDTITNDSKIYFKNKEKFNSYMKRYNKLRNNSFYEMNKLGEQLPNIQSFVEFINNWSLVTFRQVKSKKEWHLLNRFGRLVQRNEV